MNTDIIKLMDKTKPPYNVSKFNQEEALGSFKPYKFKERLTVILEQRDHLEAFELLPLIQHIYPADAIHSDKGE